MTSPEARNIVEYMVRERIFVPPADFVASISDEKLHEVLYPLSGVFGIEEVPLSRAAEFRARSHKLARHLEPRVIDGEACQIWVITE